MAALDLVTLVALNTFVLGIPMAAAAMVAAQLGVRHPALLVGSALGGLAVHGSLAFWAFYFVGREGRYVGGRCSTCTRTFPSGRRLISS